MSHRTDNNTLCVILGNRIAIKAARSGQKNPWSEGSILGKIVWKQKSLKKGVPAIVLNELVHSEFMFKDSEKYSETYGWGWARWVGVNQKPFNKGSQIWVLG